MAIARGLRPAAHSAIAQWLTVSQPAQAVGRFKLAPCDAASGPEQVGDSGRAAGLNRCIAYGHRPRLAPSGSQCHRPVAHREPTIASGWAI